MCSNKIIQNRPAANGFSLIEMMLSMLIGSIILSGIFTIFANTKEAQRTMDEHLVMVSDGRFAIEILTYDLRHASIYGGTNLATIVECRSEDETCTPTAPNPDCIEGWTHDIDLPVYSPGTDAEVDAYACAIESHVDGTDVIVIRYTDTNAVATANLAPGTTYIRSNFRAGKLFVGDGWGDFTGDTGDNFTQNYRLITRAYYISSYTDDPDDGIPSLRRIELGTSIGGAPVLTDQVLMPGIQDLQIQFGIDTDGDDVVDQYVNAVNVSLNSVTDSNAEARAQAKIDWSAIKTVKIWVLVQAEEVDTDLDTASASGAGYSLGGFNIPDSDLNDGRRRLLLSNVIRMRNMEYDALVATTTTVSP